MSDTVIMSPMKAIRANCIECCGNQVSEVRLCTATECPLYPFRMGKNPYRKKREYTEEEKAAMRERLSKNHP